MADKYKFHDDVSAPSRAPYEITPNNSTELPIIPKAIYVGTGGNIKLLGDTGTSNCTFYNVTSGQILPVRARYIFSTGTTAANLVALV